MARAVAVADPMWPTWPGREEIPVEPRPSHLVPSLMSRRSHEPSRKSYRPREIAEMHGIAESTVYAAIYKGELRSNRVGRAHVVSVEAIAEWLGAAAPGQR